MCILSLKVVGLVGRLVQKAILYQPVPTSMGKVGTTAYNVGDNYTTESVPTLPTFFSLFSNNAEFGRGSKRIFTPKVGSR